MHRFLRNFAILALAITGSFGTAIYSTGALPAVKAQGQTQMQPPSLTSAVKAVKFGRVYIVVGSPDMEIKVLYYFLSADRPERIQLTPAPDTFQLNSDGYAVFRMEATYPAPVASTEDAVCSVFLGPDGQELPHVQPLCTPVREGAVGAENYALNYTLVSGEFSGAPNTQYDLNFFFTPAGNSCAAGTPQPLNASPAPVVTDENGRRAFSIPLATPMSGGFINCKAAGPDGAASQFSACVPVTAPSCPPAISPAVGNVGVEGGGGTVNAVTLLTCGDVAVKSGADWITVMSVTPPGDSAPFTAVHYSVEPNADPDARVGTIDIGGRMFTITQAGTRPVMKLTGLEKKGKKLIVFGENFDSLAKVMVNGIAQKTRREDSARLIAPKAGKNIRRGDRIRVENSDGARSNELVY